MGASQSTKMPSLELDKPWREFNWREKESLLENLENIKSEVSFRILVVGQIGAGKSSFINSVISAFQGKIVCEALANSTEACSESFTTRFQTYHICNKNGELPFVFGDVMGLEASSLSGLQVEDVISTIAGHVRESYEFKKVKSLTPNNEFYNEKPSASEQAFVVVYVMDANTLKISDNLLCEKLKLIRRRISDQGIPQVIVLTKVDAACPLVNKDLRKLYTSKKIEELVKFCSARVGVPETSIFPVKNYHNEINTNQDVDVLVLKALFQIVDSAVRRLKKGPYTLK